MNKKTDLRIEILGIDQLQEYENNAREHGEIDITAMSMKQKPDTAKSTT